ncbi:MAG: hypothetical protein JSU92_09785 [Deltaproteobacteria bacterium]|nr:MAG: hypothetical protein JSU92_09785 [Deltaproteobacteria bacterium]
MKYQVFFIFGALLFILFLIPSNVIAHTSDVVIKFDIRTLIIPAGITTYGSLLMTIIAGLRRWKLKYHRLLAILTITFATVHAGIVILSH